jgi:hypothetical protein
MKFVSCFVPVVPRTILLVVACLFVAHSAQAKIHLKVSATAQVSASFAKWTAEKPLEQITNYSSPYANRATVDLILELQALQAGGLDFDFEINIVPNNARARLEVVQGNVDITAETTWDSLIEPDKAALLRTESIIREGEFEKGLYVLATNQPVLQVKTLDELRQFVGIAVNSWDTDVKTLRAIKLKGLELPSKNESVFAMIAKGRADFTLLEFSSEADFGIELNGTRLVPIPGVKIALAGGSRSWIVAKTSPNAEAIHAALVKGVKVLRDEGRITRAFKECGFFNARAANWKRLF